MTAGYYGAGLVMLMNDLVESARVHGEVMNNKISRVICGKSSSLTISQWDLLNGNSPWSRLI